MDRAVSDQTGRGLVFALARAAAVVAAALAMLTCFSTVTFATIRTVTNTNDSGAGSLRQAILDANASNTGDTIVFDNSVTGFILLTSGALSITSSLQIVGPGTLPAGKFPPLPSPATLAVSGGNTS